MNAFEDTEPTRCGRRAYLWVVSLCWVLPALAVSVAHFSLADENPTGQCEGIGFGCSLTPADQVVFLGLLASPLLLVIGVLSLLVVAIRQRR